MPQYIELNPNNHPHLVQYSKRRAIVQPTKPESRLTPEHEALVDRVTKSVMREVLIRSAVNTAVKGAI